MSTILASLRTNPAWKSALDQFWKDVRIKKQVAHVGKIALMNQQTAEIGKEMIRKGQQNLNQMDANMQNWEAKQDSQDKM
ncbi:MAG: hypothetical protein ACOH2A_03770 [Sphingobacteriaceae bacterium]